MRSIGVVVALSGLLGCYESQPPAVGPEPIHDSSPAPPDVDAAVPTAPAQDAAAAVLPDEPPPVDAGSAQPDAGVDAGLVDRDGDGYIGTHDCDDFDARVHPEASETCDGVDEDCDFRVDEDATDASSFFRDGDRDGFGDCADVRIACDAPDGWVSECDDCDDRDITTHPGAEEWCDGRDNDCDGQPEQDSDQCSPAIATVVDVDPGPSCSGEYSRAATLRAFGCPVVTITGTFYCESDRRNGQVVTATSDETSFELTWDDAPVGTGSDCDLDIRCRTSWVASTTADTLTITVTHEVVDHEAAAVNRCGYSITDQEDVWLYVGDDADSRTYEYRCGL